MSTALEIVTEEQLQQLKEIRKGFRKKYKKEKYFPRGKCFEMAAVVEEVLGFPSIGGFVTFEGLWGNESRGSHYWNKGPENSIIDISGDQFNDVPGVYVTKQDSRYQQTS